MLIYIGIAAQSYGVSASEAYTLVSIANAASFIGRLSTGYLADRHALFALLTGCTDDSAVSRYGPLNIMGPSTIVAAVMTYGSSLRPPSSNTSSQDMSKCFSILPVAWPHARTYHSTIPIAVLYGISNGAFITLHTVPLLSLGKPDEVGERLGLFFTIIAFGAMCGPPISGAIWQASEGWEIVGVYAGKCKEAIG